MTSILNEKNFLIEIITDFQGLLSFMDIKFGQKYAFGLMYNAASTHEEKQYLTLEGTMMLYFIKLTKRPYPKIPTNEDIKYINAIWDTFGYPEKKLPLI
jgi:hypothetical protein